MPDGFKTIEDRRAYHREYKRRRYAALRDAGKCIICERRKPIKGQLRCRKCAARLRAYAYARRARLRAEGKGK